MTVNNLIRILAASLLLLLAGCFHKEEVISSCPQLEKGEKFGTDEPIIFLPGLKGIFKPKTTSAGKRGYNSRDYGSRADNRNLTLLSGPHGLVMDEYGVLTWNPSSTTPAGHYQVSFVDNDNEKADPVILELSIPPNRAVKGEVNDRYFKVTDKESGLLDYVFEFKNAVTANHAVLREIPQGCLPDRKYFHSIVSSGFYSPTLSDVDFNLFVPEKKVHHTWWTTLYTTSTDAHHWTNYHETLHGIEFFQHWGNFIKSHEKTVQIEGLPYVPFRRINGNGLVVIGLSHYDKENY